MLFEDIDNRHTVITRKFWNRKSTFRLIYDFNSSDKHETHQQCSVNMDLIQFKSNFRTYQSSYFLCNNIKCTSCSTVLWLSLYLGTLYKYQLITLNKGLDVGWVQNNSCSIETIDNTLHTTQTTVPWNLYLNLSKHNKL